MLQSLQCEVRFESVSLQYPSSSQHALVDVSFTLSKGKTLALVGPSGAGKSSIADLLTCLYDATSGQIFVDNRPLPQVNIASWQNRIGVVSQDIQLFNASIAENVAFGVESATDLMIEDACKTAAAHSFITSLPNGYRTIVGERGYRLSGGQRQRLAMARAVLRNPDLLILDEATSALDSQTEQVIQHAVDALRERREIIVIVNRPVPYTNTTPR